MIRAATLSDNESIREIYNFEVLNGVATFDTDPRDASAQKLWFEEHGSLYPILVWEENHQIIAWASLNRWSPRKAYALTSEVSLYITPAHQGRGIGGKLLPAILSAGKKKGLHCVLARITEGNQLSIDLHLKNGFEIVGCMKEVGNKFGRLLDVTLLQKLL